MRIIGNFRLQCFWLVMTRILNCCRVVLKDFESFLSGSAWVRDYLRQPQSVFEKFPFLPEFFFFILGLQIRSRIKISVVNKVPRQDKNELNLIFKFLLNNSKSISRYFLKKLILIAIVLCAQLCFLVNLNLKWGTHFLSGMNVRLDLAIFTPP